MELDAVNTALYYQLLETNLFEDVTPFNNSSFRIFKVKGYFFPYHLCYYKYGPYYLYWIPDKGLEREALDYFLEDEVYLNEDILDLMPKELQIEFIFYFNIFTNSPEKYDS